MKLGPNLKKYEADIREAIYAYARSNYHHSPLLEEVECEWQGEVFQVSNMERDLHEDLIIDLKEKGVYKKIKETFDKFVILPDVFSVSKIPITGPLYPRNEFDLDRKNIVFLNGKVMELFLLGKTIYQYNHNRKTYTFYKSSESSSLFESDSPKMSVLYIYKGSHVSDIKGHEDQWEASKGPDDYLFSFNMNNVLTDENVDRVGVAIHHPHIIFDYNKTVDDKPEIIIHGLISLSNDMFLTPKWFNMHENEVLIHNESLYFTNTFIIIYDDNTYNIENTYIKSRDEFIEKIDKHTIMIHKDPKIAKIVIFCTQRTRDFKDTDSLYYKATKENVMSCYRFREHQKYTNDLLTYMNENMDISIDKLIDWGYKYDRDVLVAIQNYFATVRKLNVETTADVTIEDSYGNNKFIKPKLLFHVNNKFDWYPNLFTNHKLYPGDYKIIRGVDNSIIVIDPETYFNLVDPNNIHLPTKDTNSTTIVPPSGVLPDYKPPVHNPDPYLNKEWIRDTLIDIVQDCRIILTPYRIISSTEDGVSRQGGRIFRAPLYRNEVIRDMAGYDPTKNIYTGALFVNGYLTTENNKDNRIFRWLDDINLFGTGQLNFTVTSKSNPTDAEVYSPSSDYIMGKELSVLINRTTDKLIGINRVSFENMSRHVIDYAGHDIPKTVGVIPLKEWHTIGFDKYGIECTDKIDVLTKEYINFDYMYNYVAGNGVVGDMSISISTPLLKDEFMQFDLEIDEDRIDKHFNKGSFNENAIQDENIRALFNPNEPDAIRPIPIQLKTNRKLLTEKILTRYWLAYLGKNNPDMSSELSGLNGVIMNSDGTLGTDLEDYQYFIKSDNLRGDKPLISVIGAQNILYTTLLASGISYIDYTSMLDSNRAYEVEIPSKYHSLEQNKTLDIGNWMLDLNSFKKED